MSRATVISRRRRAASMQPVEEYVLVERYKIDSSIVYDCDETELNILLGEFGEMEPIIDAINVLAGASDVQRARDLGLSLDEFLG